MPKVYGKKEKGNRGSYIFFYIIYIWLVDFKTLHLWSFK